MDYSIRVARETDAESMVKLLEPIIQQGYTALQEVSVPTQIDFIRHFPKNGSFLVAVCEPNQEVLGMQDVLPGLPEVEGCQQVGEISTFVAMHAHRKGIGQQLTQATFQALRKLDFFKIQATIRADNPRAIAFYQSQGFQIIEPVRQYSEAQGRFIETVHAERFTDSDARSRRLPR